jgi:hypothetical protein
MQLMPHVYHVRDQIEFALHQPWHTSVILHQSDKLSHIALSNPVGSPKDQTLENKQSFSDATEFRS